MRLSLTYIEIKKNNNLDLGDIFDIFMQFDTLLRSAQTSTLKDQHVVFWISVWLILTSKTILVN